MRIAIADDDTAFVDFLKNVTSADGHSCVVFNDGQSLVTQLQRETFDLVILDWHMPRLTGPEVLGWIHQNLEVPPPVIMLTSQYNKSDIARTLSEGADDFIVKPETAAVISARIDAVLRRTSQRNAPQRHIDFGGYRFDRLESTVSFDGEEQKLTAKEFSLALLFFQNTNRPLSRGYLLDMIWNSVAGLPTRTLDVHVSHIRAKLKLAAGRGYRLQTIVSYGYRLEVCAEDE
ncbi:MAG: response regulator transcription factor [Sphingomonadales bacterium]|nr:response regulator transcription factor [Sphingomonadales bacterium]MDE2168532.1 response regulator transcription factor [Sphingomonadales bacterium]